MADFEVDRTLDEVCQSAGIDEVGRGCLAGPVVVASVTWNHREVAKQDWFSDLADSKTLDAATRAALFPRICGFASRVRTAALHPALIDTLNILAATLHGFELVAPKFSETCPLFIDGNQKPPSLGYAQTVVKGDSRSSAIAAASVIAKVTRDGLMQHLDKREPGYGFARHMGYGTPAHRKAIELDGPGNFHRKSFSPVKQLASSPVEADDLLLNMLASTKKTCDPWTLWQRLVSQYASFSLGGVQRAVKLLQEKGLCLMPSVRDQPFL